MKRILTTSVMAAALALVGCTQRPLDANWGSSVAGYRSAMTADPSAGTTDPILGVGPLTGEIIIETYLTEQRNTESESESIVLQVAE